MPPSSRTGMCGEGSRACFTHDGPGRAHRRWYAARALWTFVTRSAWRKSPGNQPVPSVRPGHLPLCRSSVPPRCSFCCPLGATARFPGVSASSPAPQATGNPSTSLVPRTAEPAWRGASNVPFPPLGPAQVRASGSSMAGAGREPAGRRRAHVCIPALAKACAYGKSCQVPCGMFRGHVRNAK
jgi:hypothetical protein